MSEPTSAPILNEQGETIGLTVTREMTRNEFEAWRKLRYGDRTISYSAPPEEIHISDPDSYGKP